MKCRYISKRHNEQLGPTVYSFSFVPVLEVEILEKIFDVEENVFCFLVVVRLSEFPLNERSIVSSCAEELRARKKCNICNM